MNILFIVNPIAGKNKSTDVSSLIRKKMKEVNVKYKIEVTKSHRHAVSITKAGLKEGYEVMVAVGGDGTINEVAEGILSTRSGVLGIIPMGTGNDLAKSLGLSMNPNDAIDTILNEKIQKIDIGRVDNKTFLNVGSIGFDTEVAKNSEKIKRIFKGRLSYMFGVLATLFTYKSKTISIELDNDSFEQEILLVAVGNGKYYGGGMKICPTAELKDNYFDICVIKKISKLKLLFIFPSVFKGEHLKFSKYVKMYKSSMVKIETNDNLYLNIDGEVYDFKGSNTFSMNEDKIDVIA